MQVAYTYRPLSFLTRLVVVLLGLGIVSGAVNSYSSVKQLELLNRSEYTEEEGEANDTRQSVLALADLGLYIVTAVCFAVWIVRAHRNVRAMGARALTTTPGWAVGSFFIPILNLFRPYQAMRDLLQASRDPAKWRSAPGSPVLPLWWALWLISYVVHRIAFQMVRGDNPGRTNLIEGTKFMIGGELLDIALCLAAMGVVLMVAKAQSASTAGGVSLVWPSEHWQAGERPTGTAEGEGREDDGDFAFRR